MLVTVFHLDLIQMAVQHEIPDQELIVKFVEWLSGEGREMDGFSCSGQQSWTVVWRPHEWKPEGLKHPNGKHQAYAPAIFFACLLGKVVYFGIFKPKLFDVRWAEAISEAFILQELWSDAVFRAAFQVQAMRENIRYTPAWTFFCRSGQTEPSRRTRVAQWKLETKLPCHLSMMIACGESREWWNF